jgi:hypothetical protein
VDRTKVQSVRLKKWSGNERPLGIEAALFKNGKDLFKRLEFGDRFSLFAPVLIRVIVFGAKFLTKHEVLGLHVANFERLFGLRPRPTFVLPAQFSRRCRID